VPSRVIPKGQPTTTLPFEYEGALPSAEDSPVEGLKLAYTATMLNLSLYPELVSCDRTALTVPATFHHPLPRQERSSRQRPGQAEKAAPPEKSYRL